MRPDNLSGWHVLWELSGGMGKGLGKRHDKPYTAEGVGGLLFWRSVRALRAVRSVRTIRTVRTVRAVRIFLGGCYFNGDEVVGGENRMDDEGGSGKKRGILGGKKGWDCKAWDCALGK
jgi:hypothetical protein